MRQYLCVGAVQYKNATQYHRDLEFIVAKRNHDERNLKLNNIPNRYTCRLYCDIPGNPCVRSMINMFEVRFVSPP